MPSCNRIHTDRRVGGHRGEKPVAIVCGARNHVMSGMDYDATTIAATYDKARGYSPEVLSLWLDVVAAHIPLSLDLIVDVGCGTGRFSLPLAHRFQARVIGIDPSQKMLEVARQKTAGDRVEFRQGTAEDVPLPDACADLVFLSMMIHH